MGEIGLLILAMLLPHPHPGYVAATGSCSDLSPHPGYVAAIGCLDERCH